MLLALLPLSLVADPLPSWNDTTSKKAIISFVEKVTKEGSSDFVPPAERIATFDNDGCLWSEQPMYFQAFYIFDRIRELAPKHPEWKEKEPFASVLKGGIKGALAGGEKALLEMAMATHAGVTSEEFNQIVGDWLATARHPKTGMAYHKMIFQPMLELLDYLRSNGFKTFIVSGGGIDFLRVFAEEAYGIPRRQARQGARRRTEARVGHRRHEKGVEGHLPAKGVISHFPNSVTKEDTVALASP